MSNTDHGLTLLACGDYEGYRQAVFDAEGDWLTDEQIIRLRCLLKQYVDEEIKQRLN